MDIKDKKLILNNPVVYYLKTLTNNNTSSLDTIKGLSGEREELIRQLKKLKVDKGKISRTISELKQSNMPFLKLIDEMKIASNEAKHTSLQLSSLEEKLLAYFITDDENKGILSTSTLTSNSNLEPLRAYSLSSVNLDSIQVHRTYQPIPEWNQYVEGNKAATIYHRQEWQPLISSTFGHNTVYLYATNNENELVGILPITQLKSKVFGNFLVSVPYFNYGGAVGDHAEIELLLINKAAELSADLDCQHIECRDTIARDGFPVRTDKVNMILQLPDTIDLLWSGFSKKLRAQIKRPQKEATTTKLGSINLLSDFYFVFSRNMRDLGTPVYTKEFFKNILETFPEDAHIIIVYLNNRPVSAGFLIGYKDTLEIPWASTIRDVNNLSINMLLYWEVLKFAINNSFKFFDFGRSSKGAGTYRFKKQWGANPKQLYWHYWLKDGGDIPTINPSNPKYALFIYFWKKLPIFITQIIGPHIVKYLP